MKRVVRRSAMVLFFIAVIIGAWILFTSGHYDVLSPQGVIADQQKKLLIFTLLLSAVVVLPVFFMLGLFAWRYRASKESSKKHYRPNWDSSRVLESIWWGIPITIIAVLAVVTWVTSHQLDPYRSIVSSKEPLEVQVVALEWKWLFLYPDLGVASTNQLPVIVDRPIHFTLTADAPMSAFWVPALGSQIYTMNGMASQLNLMATKEGSFAGYSTNINGKGYADMKFEVKSMSEQDFKHWLNRAKKSDTVLDAKKYDALRAPTTENSVITYRLKDKDLFESVIMKYMAPSSDNSSKSPNSNEDNRGEHTMHTMEGME